MADTAEISIHNVTEVRIESVRGNNGSYWATAYIKNVRGEYVELCLYGVDNKPIIVKLGEEE